jgi:hypothetical protein
MSASWVDSIVSESPANSSHHSVCIASMIRLYTLKYFGLTADPTWDNIPVTLWTTLETTTAVVCTCLPSIRAGLLRAFLLVHIHPRPQSSSAKTQEDLTKLRRNSRCPSPGLQKSFRRLRR